MNLTPFWNREPRTPQPPGRRLLASPDRSGRVAGRDRLVEPHPPGPTRRCLALAGSALLLASGLPLCGQSPLRFEEPILRNGFPMLTLVGGEPNYAIESSTDLKSWHAVLSAPPTNGRLSFLVLDSPGWDSTFYRAHAGSVALPGPLTVRPAADPEAGGPSAPHGGTVVLEWPPNPSSDSGNRRSSRCC
jgi:hypothetical protein